MKFDFLDLSNALEHVYTKRLALRPVSVVDAWPIFQASRNELFNKHLLWPQPKSEQEVLTRLKLIADASRSGALSGVSAVVRETGEFIALFRFLEHKTKFGAIEMGIWTSDRFWCGRYSLEIVRLCIAAAFSLSNVQLLVGASFPDNRPSCTLMRMAGMTPLDLVMRDSEKGHPVLLQEYAITRKEWERHEAMSFEVFEPTAPVLAPAFEPEETGFDDLLMNEEDT
jgi:RimJ/RimL family protein N-acetyltransferase